MASVLVVTSKVKALAKTAVKGTELRTSGEFIDALSDKVEALVKAAAEKAKEDGRGTLKARDLESSEE